MFKNIDEVEAFLMDKTGMSKILLDEIKAKDTQITEMQKQIDSLSLTILNAKAGGTNE